VPPWKSPPHPCAACGNTVAKSTLSDDGRCVTCVSRKRHPEQAEEPLPLFEAEA
jgi:hypothetical protein